jgi:hypothetical protein
MNAVIDAAQSPAWARWRWGAGAAAARGRRDLGQAVKQATNWTAIIMFGVFVIFTLFITKWAAAKTKSAADFYTAGGGITGFQNGLAIAGDYMSAASFLGISAAVLERLRRPDLLHRLSGRLAVITFLMAERLRNLGKFTFADVAAYRFKQTPIRIFAASGTLVVVAFYLIAQMVGAGQLIKLLFGLEYWIAVVLVGALMMIYVLFGGMTATTWVQIIKAVLLLGGAFHGLHGAGAVRLQPGSAVRQGRRRARHQGSHHGPGLLHQGSRSRPSLRHGADVRHRRPAAHPDALLHRAQRQGSAQVRVLGHHLDRLLLHPDLHHRLRRHRAGEHQPEFKDAAANCWAATTWRPCTWPRPWAATCSSASSRPWPSPPSWPWWPA